MCIARALHLYDAPINAPCMRISIILLNTRIYYYLHVVYATLHIAYTADVSQPYKASYVVNSSCEYI